MGDDMKKRVTLFNIIFTATVGTLLHFVYDWSGQSPIAAIFSAVNESVWEHLKLLFWPVAVLSVVQFFTVYKDSQSFMLSRFVGMICGMVTIITVYYTVSGVTGSELGFFNVLLFYAAVILTFVLDRVFRKNGLFGGRYSNIIGFILFAVLAVLFSVYSFNPPDAGIFKEPS